MWRKGFVKEMSFKSGVKGRGSDRWWERGIRSLERINIAQILSPQVAPSLVDRRSRFGCAHTSTNEFVRISDAFARTHNGA